MPGQVGRAAASPAAGRGPQARVRLYPQVGADPLNMLRIKATWFVAGRRRAFALALLHTSLQALYRVWVRLKPDMESQRSDL